MTDDYQDHDRARGVLRAEKEHQEVLLSNALREKEDLVPVAQGIDQRILSAQSLIAAIDAAIKNLPATLIAEPDLGFETTLTPKDKAPIRTFDEPVEVRS